MEKTIDYPSTAQQFIDDFVLDLLEEAPLLEEKPSDSVPIKLIPNPAIPLFTLPGGADIFLHTKRNGDFSHELYIFKCILIQFRKILIAMFKLF